MIVAYMGLVLFLFFIGGGYLFIFQERWIREWDWSGQWICLHDFITNVQWYVYELSSPSSYPNKEDNPASDFAGAAGVGSDLTATLTATLGALLGLLLEAAVVEDSDLTSTLGVTFATIFGITLGTTFGTSFGVTLIILLSSSVFCFLTAVKTSI